MKILFIGLGSIGQRHARLLLEMNRGFELMALRSKKSPPVQFPILEVLTWEEVAKNNPTIAFITNPTSMHISTATRCAELGYKLFIEKPLGCSIDGLDDLVSCVLKNKIVSYVAYNLRFHPVIQKLKEYMNKGTFLHMSVVCSSFLPNWRPSQEAKMTYSAIKALGGGVVLDLSHEIDYTTYLLGKILSISGRCSKRSVVTVDAEDWADMVVSCERGPALIHINFFSQIKQRQIQIDFTEFSVAADLNRGIVQEFINERETNRYEYDCQRDYTYLRQIEYFIQNSDNTSMMNNILDAREVFNQILNFKENAIYYE